MGVIWNKAEAALKNAEHIIFCGYSFPDADMHVKYLLKRVQTNRSRKPLKVTVINDHAGKSEATREEEKRRYVRFLGDAIDYTKSSFENFAGEPGKFLLQ